MKITTLTIDLYIYGAYSKKDQRRVIKSIIDRSQNTYRVSAADISPEEIINRTLLAFVFVSNEYRQGEQIMRKIIHMIDGYEEVEIIHQEIDFL